MIWQSVEEALTLSALALDLLGRGSHPADLNRITLDLAVHQAVQDIEAETEGPIILVAHSIGGALPPGIIAALTPKVERLIYICAVAAPDRGPAACCRIGGVRRASLVQRGRAPQIPATHELRRARRAPDAGSAPGARPLQRDPRRLAQLRLCAELLGGGESAAPEDSPAPDPRPPLSPDAQRWLVLALGAEEAIEIDVGQNVACSAPIELARLLDALACGRH